MKPANTSFGPDTLTRYYEDAFTQSQNANYRPFNMWESLSHERKMELLRNLPLPDLRSATAVDYGVGSWGFGGVFPKLKACRKAIGIDISQAAISRCREVSEQDPELKHAELEFYTSSGYVLPLPEASVDIFFAGECIEHIEETDSFLAEVHRVLKQDGIAIFTTPNRLPYVYRILDLEWCMGYEHVALMSYSELLDYTETYFSLEIAKGFNQSLHPALDTLVDERTARSWVHGSEDDPENATGLIIMVRKIKQIPLHRPQVNVFEYQQGVVVKGPWRDVHLFENFKGRLLSAGAQMQLIAPQVALRCQLILWAHPWSGQAQILVDGQLAAVVDLYAHVSGCRRLRLTVKPGSLIQVSALGDKRADSQGTEVIFVRAVFG